MIVFRYRRPDGSLGVVTSGTGEPQLHDITEMGDVNDAYATEVLRRYREAASE